MTDETPLTTYSLKYGGIDQVLAGEGKPVDNFEDLYLSDTNAGRIIIPKVIGVHQTIGCEHGKLLEARASDMVQRVVSSKYGTEDGVDGALISLVYSPGVLDEKVLRALIAGKDVLARLKLVDYSSAPDFTNKPIISGNRVETLLDHLESKKTREKALTLLEREIEYFVLNRTLYGLTRIEAVNQNALTGMVDRLKEYQAREKAGDLGSEKSGLITDPLAIRLTELFQELAKRYLKE